MATKHSSTIAKMKAWCLKNYENGADTMVECWADADYERLLADCGSAREAWIVLRRVAAVYRDRQADARNCAF